MNLSTKQKKTHAREEQTGGHLGQGVGAGGGGGLGSADVSLYAQVDRYGPTAQHRSYTQCPVLHHDGKEHQTCVCVFSH